MALARLERKLHGATRVASLGNNVRTSNQLGDVVIAIPVLLVGGTEMHTLALARALQSAGATARVCCYYEYSSSMVSLFEGAGIEVTLLHMERAAGLWHLFRVLSTMFTRMRPSVVHVQYIAPGLIPVAAAKAAGVRTVFATVHQPGDGFGFRKRLFLLIAAHLCTAFFCVSEAVERSWFGSSGMFLVETAVRGCRHFTIYNGVDTTESHESFSRAIAEELRVKLGLVGRRVIGVVARLRVEKGHALLLDSFALVLKAFHDAVLLIVGDGPAREALREQARALGVERHLVWAGERSPDEVKALYSVMDVVAVPSQFEGFGLTAVEAMAAERPVVATRVGGLVEIVEDGVTGYLISSESSTAYAGALIKILGDESQAILMGARGRKRVSEKFSLEQFSESIVGAYRYFMKDGGGFDGSESRLPHST